MERNIISEKATIGKNVQIGAFCIIEDDVVIGDNTIIKSYVELRKGTIIGSDCYIDSRVSSSGNCVIGNKVTVRYDSIIARGVKIGDGTYICPKMMSNNLNTEHEQIGGADIGENVFVGTGCVLQHGISIGDNSVLGSMSFVNKNVPANEIWFGNPAKFKKSIEEANK
jgi:UDP-N-acetylglucosamine acyltransferase